MLIKFSTRPNKLNYQKESHNTSIGNDRLTKSFQILFELILIIPLI